MQILELPEIVGIGLAATLTVAEALDEQLSDETVTVYIPDCVTVMEEEVAPVLQR